MGKDLDTSAISVSATDCRSGKGTGREIRSKGTGLDSICFGELNCRLRRNR